MVKLNWEGDKVERVALDHVSDAMVEFGLRCETAAKKRLQPGHGVKTGTLRRSIHLATPGYNWPADNVEPSPTTPERGGNEADPAEKKCKLVLELGSGMEYAMAVHQGHGSFEGYHFLTEAVDEQKPKLPSILERHRLK